MQLLLIRNSIAKDWKLCIISVKLQQMDKSKK